MDPLASLDRRQFLRGTGYLALSFALPGVALALENAARAYRALAAFGAPLAELTEVDLATHCLG